MVRSRLRFGAIAGIVAALLAPAGHRASAREEARPVAAQQAGLSTAMRTSYRLDPAGGAVHVDVRITLRNTQADVVEGPTVRRSFLDRYGVSVLAEAEGFVASREGTPLPVQRRPRSGTPLAVASIDLQPDLFFGDTQVLDLSYRLPALPPRSEGFSRVNPAYVTFPAFTGGDPGAADLEVIVPAGFEVELVGDEMERRPDGDSIRYTAEDIAEPDSFLTSIVARDDDALVAVPVRFGDDELTVLGWPGDEEWARFVATKVERGVPILEELVGLPWPGSDDLQVIETASPYLYGYAGWYLPSQSLVEIGDELDGEVILHELSHLWFNHDLFAERWINEGLAEVYAGLTLERMGEPSTGPGPVGPNDPARIALVDWSDPDLDEPISDGQERYGYDAAQLVMGRIETEIGTRALSRVVVAAHAREVPYGGDGDPLRYPAAPGWQALLDLLEDVGGSTGAADLFALLVVPDASSTLFDARTASRDDYAALASAGGAWTVPRGVRQAMSEWRFDDADAVMAVALEVLEVRAAVAEVLDPVQVPVPTGFERAYEEALVADELAGAAGGVVAASTQVADAVRAERAATGPLAAVGLLGGRADRTLSDARGHLDEGAYEDARSSAVAAASAYDGAARAGAQRIALALLALVALTLWARRRQARHHHDVSGRPASASDEERPENA